MFLDSDDLTYFLLEKGLLFLLDWAWGLRVEGFEVFGVSEMLLIVIWSFGSKLWVFMFARLNGFVFSVKIPFAGKIFVKEISGVFKVELAEGSSGVFEVFLPRPRLGLGGSADFLPMGDFNFWGLGVRARDSISN
jgi:hypothetical protein